jgi:hypothetical protein
MKENDTRMKLVSPQIQQINLSFTTEMDKPMSLIICLLFTIGATQSRSRDPTDAYLDFNFQCSADIDHGRYGKHQLGIQDGDLILAVFIPVHGLNSDAIYGMYYGK